MKKKISGNFNQLTLKKPDGRNLYLYSRRPISPELQAPSPNSTPLKASPHLRWHPVRGEWVAYASHRQNRTFLPPPEYNPLAPTQSSEFPTEVPAGDFDIAVFENLFPTFVPSEFQSSLTEQGVYTPVQPAIGACEVVVYSQDSQRSLSRLSLSHIELLLQVWADRTDQIGSRKEIQYVMPFENKGVEVGVTLHHPHSQIYAYSFVPPVAQRALEQQKIHWDQKGRALIEEVIAQEIKDARRILYRGEHAIAFVPAFARYSYEVWVAPIRAKAFLSDLTETERADLALALKTVLLKYDGLWKRPFPYLMFLHQAPTDGQAHPEAHLHFQFYPPYRSSDRLKYLAGTEIGAGTFSNDSLPEEKAAELQKIEVKIETDNS